MHTAQSQPRAMSIEYDSANDAVVITIPADATTIAAAAPSASGRSNIVATTKGFRDVDGTEVRVAVNAIVRP